MRWKSWCIDKSKKWQSAMETYLINIWWCTGSMWLKCLWAAFNTFLFTKRFQKARSCFWCLHLLLLLSFIDFQMFYGWNLCYVWMETWQMWEIQQNAKTDAVWSEACDVKISFIAYWQFCWGSWLQRFKPVVDVWWST